MLPFVLHGVSTGYRSIVNTRWITRSGWIILGQAVGCMSPRTFHETAAPGEMHLARGSLSVGCWRIFVWGMRKEDGEKSAIICLLLKLKYFTLIEVEIRVNVM